MASFSAFAVQDCPDCTIESNQKILDQFDLVTGYLNGNCFDRAELFYNQLQSDYEKGKIGDLTLQANMENFKQWRDYSTLQRWIKAYPNSYSANVALGLFFRENAITAQSKSQYETLLNKALDYFHAAEKLTHKNAYIKTFMLRAYRMLGDDDSFKSTISEIFKNDPDALPYISILYNLGPDYSSSPEDFTEFYQSTISKKLPKWEHDVLATVYHETLSTVAEKQKAYPTAFKEAAEALKTATDSSYEIPVLQSYIRSARKMDKDEIKTTSSVEKQIDRLIKLDARDIYAHELKGFLHYNRHEYSDAFKMFELSANPTIHHPDGGSIAQRFIAIMYRDGLGIPKDQNKAIHYFLMAQKQGDNYSGEQLVKLNVLPSIHKN